MRLKQVYHGWTYWMRQVAVAGSLNSFCRRSSLPSTAIYINPHRQDSRRVDQGIGDGGFHLVDMIDRLGRRAEFPNRKLSSGVNYEKPSASSHPRQMSAEEITRWNKPQMFVGPWEVSG
jgi:hypothetical protein